MFQFLSQLTNFGPRIETAKLLLIQKDVRGCVWSETFFSGQSMLWNRKKFLPQTRESCLTFFGQQLEAVFAFSFAENSRVIYLRNLITQEI